MAVVASDGTTVLSKSALIAKASAVTLPTVYQFNEDVYETYDFPGETAVEGHKRLLYKTGQQVPAAYIDALDAYANTATVTGVSPSTGLTTAGGTKVTITGTNLGGVTSVTFGGTAGTSLTKVSRTKLTVLTPAKTAGSQAVVVVDDSGNVAAGNVTFA